MASAPEWMEISWWIPLGVKFIEFILCPEASNYKHWTRFRDFLAFAMEMNEVHLKESHSEQSMCNLYFGQKHQKQVSESRNHSDVTLNWKMVKLVLLLPRNNLFLKRDLTKSGCEFKNKLQKNPRFLLISFFWETRAATLF